MPPIKANSEADKLDLIDNVEFLLLAGIRLAHNHILISFALAY